MPRPTFVPVTGVIKVIGTGADEELGPTGDDVVGAGMDDGAGTGAVGTAAVGTGVDADGGYEDRAVAEFTEPEGYVCLDAEGEADRLAFPAGGALCSHTLHFSFPLLVVCAPPALNLRFLERLQASLPHG